MWVVCVCVWSAQSDFQRIHNISFFLLLLFINCLLSNGIEFNFNSIPMFSVCCVAVHCTSLFHHWLSATCSEIQKNTESMCIENNGGNGEAHDLNRNPFIRNYDGCCAFAEYAFCYRRERSLCADTCNFALLRWATGPFECEPTESIFIDANLCHQKYELCTETVMWALKCGKKIVFEEEKVDFSLLCKYLYLFDSELFARIALVRWRRTGIGQSQLTTNKGSDLFRDKAPHVTVSGLHYVFPEYFHTIVSSEVKPVYIIQTSLLPSLRDPTHVREPCVAPITFEIQF